MVAYRWESFSLEMLRLPTNTSPPSMGIEPQMMFSREVLPLPLLPTMATNWPSSTVREKCSNSRCSVRVPGL